MYFLPDNYINIYYYLIVTINNECCQKKSCWGNKMLYKQKENVRIYDKIKQYKNELRDIVRVERNIDQDYLRNILAYQRKNAEYKLDKLKYNMK